jgi:hypothetical protein
LAKSASKHRELAETDGRAVLWLANQLDALFLVTAFRGFRDLTVAELLVDLKHKSCGQKPTILPDYIDRFIDINWLARADRKRFPLLTAQDFALIQERTQSVSAATHSHLLSRAVEFVSVYTRIFGTNKSPLNLEQDLSLLKALKTGKPQGILKFTGRQTTRFSKDAVLHNLNTFVNAPSVMCRDETCEVGKDTAQWGYLERVRLRCSRELTQ